jgi:hypothetical protein
MSVSTLANFIAAVNATTGKSGSVYNASSPDAFGTILISRAPSAAGAFVAFQKVFFSTQPNNSVIRDVNPNGTQVIIKGENSGLNDAERYCDAQDYINMLAAN